MGDQEADIGRMRDCARDLRRIREALGDQANPAQGYGVAEIGSQLILQRFDDFESNWRIRREQLMGELDALQRIIAGAAQSYEELDRALVDALRRSDEGNSS
ncbi:hypothetical protein AAH978_17395 [Streptomyces sp. ZYX-F-203]